MGIFQKNKRSCNRFINSRQHDRAFLVPDFLMKLPVKPPYMAMGSCTAKFVYITANAVLHEFCERRLNLQESTSLYIRELWQRGWKHQNVLFPKNSYAFASGASHSVSYGPAVWLTVANYFPGKTTNKLNIWRMLLANALPVLSAHDLCRGLTCL